MTTRTDEQKVVDGIGLAMRAGMASFIPAFLATLEKQGLEVRVKSPVEGVQLPFLDAEGNTL